MFTYLRNLFVLLAVVLFSACELFESPNGEKEAYVRITPSSELIFPSSASNCSITIESSGEWTITGANDWVTVSPDRGDYGTDVIVSVATNELSEERSAELMVLCDGAEATITIVQEQKIDTDYVDMAFDDAGTTIHYDAASGDMTVTYSNESNVPDVVEGSAIVLPADYQFDIRVVESVSTSGNTISLSTSQGNMCNLFRNTSFTLSTIGDTRAAGVDGHPVIAPVAVGYLDESGKYVEVYNADKQATRDSYSSNTELWSFDLDYSGDTLWNGGGGRLWWDKCSFDAGLKGLFNFSFGEKSGGGILGKVGDLESFSYTLQGNVAVDMLMRYRYENSATFSDDRILKYNVIPTGVYTFLVNGVTVHLLVYTHLGQYVELGVEGSVEVSGGVNLGMDIEGGMSWTKDVGFETIKSATPRMSIYHPTVQVKASAHAKLSYYPQIEIGLYNFIGPWFEPRSYIKEVVSAGAGASTNGDSYVAFQDEYFSGLDMRMGLKLDFGMFDKEVAKTDIFNVVDDTLLTTSPARLSLVSPQSSMQLDDEESVDVTFKVEAYSPVTGKYWACENAAVVFETESGQLSDYVVLSDASGEVLVNWNLSTTCDKHIEHTLHAYIYSCDGTIIDEAICKVNRDQQMSIEAISYKDDYYYYTSDDGNSYVFYNLSAIISGDTSKFENICSCGIYLYDKNTGKSYIWSDGLSGHYNNTEIEFEIGVNISNFDNIDYSKYYAETMRYGFGIYVEDSNGNYYVSDYKPITFIYDRRPSFRYASVGDINVSIINETEDENGDLLIEYHSQLPVTIEITGAYWIESMQHWITGTWEYIDTGEKYTSPYVPDEDTKYNTYYNLYYDSDMVMSHEEYCMIKTKSGETIKSNSLIYGGSPENPTVQISDAARISDIDTARGICDNDNNTPKCSMVMIPSKYTTLDKEKIMTVDDLLVINLNR